MTITKTTTRTCIYSGHPSRPCPAAVSAGNWFVSAHCYVDITAPVLRKGKLVYLVEHIVKISNSEEQLATGTTELKKVN